MKKILAIFSFVIIFAMPIFGNASTKCESLFKTKRTATFNEWIFDRLYFPPEVQSNMSKESVIDSVKVQNNIVHFKIVDTESSNGGMGTINPRTVKVPIDTAIKYLEETVSPDAIKANRLESDLDTAKDLLIFLLKARTPTSELPKDRIVSAIEKGSARIAMVYHLKYGEGYVTLNKKTGTVNFDQNSHDARPVENVSYKDIALELPLRVESHLEIQRNMPFTYKGEKFLTFGQFADGSILARGEISRSLKKISLKDVQRGVLALSRKELYPDDKVNISPDFKQHTSNAVVLEIQGIYALVAYSYNEFSIFNQLPYDSRPIHLIPLSQLTKANGASKAQSLLL